MARKTHDSSGRSRRRVLKQVPAAIAATALAGCSDSSQGNGAQGTATGGAQSTQGAQTSGQQEWLHQVQQEDTGEIVVTNYSDISGDPATADVIDSWEQETGNTVSLQEIPGSSVGDKTLTLLQSRSADPDVYQLGHELAFRFGQDAYFERLNNYISEEEFNQWAEPAQKMATWPEPSWQDFPDPEGIYYPPMWGTGWFVYSNDSVLEEAGLDSESVPNTYSGFLDALDQVSEVVDTPLLLPMSASYVYIGVWQNMTMRAGAPWFENGSYQFDSDAHVQAAQFMMDLINEGYAPEGITSLDEGATANQFYQNNAGFMINTLPFMMREVKNGQQGHELSRIHLFPKPDNAGDVPTGSLGVIGKTLSKFSHQKDAGAKYLAHASGQEAHARHLLVEGNMPCRADAFDVPEVQNNVPQTETIREHLTGSDIQTYPNASEVDSIVFDNFTNAVANNWDGQRLSNQIQRAASGL